MSRTVTLLAVTALAVLGAQGGVAQQRPATSPQRPAARVARVERGADGFSFAVPQGWAEAKDPKAAAKIVRQGAASVSIVVTVQREKPGSEVLTVLDGTLAALQGDARRSLVSSRIDMVASRTGLIAVMEDATTRHKLLLFARDTADRSDIYYSLMLSAPHASFEAAEAVLDRLAGSFQIGPIKGAPAPVRAAAPPAAAPAAPPPPPEPPFDREAAIERILRPRPPDQE